MNIDDDVQASNGLTVQQLRSFCAVFEKQSYSEAAREADLSVPTMWEQVRSLEKRYRAVLFERRGRRICSTPSAATLYESLRPLLAGLDSTFELLREEQDDPARTVTLVSGARIMMEDLGTPLKRFRERHPNVCLRLMHYNDQVASELVASGDADLALTIESGPGGAVSDVDAERAYRIDYLALFPKRHPLARKAVPSLADLAGYPLIVGHKGTYIRRLFDQAIHRAGLSDRAEIAVETDTSAFTIACVKAGIGVGVIAGRAPGALCRGLAVRSLGAEIGEAWTAFRWKKGRHLTPTLVTLMRLIREAAETPAQPA